MRKKKDKGDKVKPGEEFIVTWKDLVDPKDKEHVSPDIDSMQPVDWDSEQAPE